MATSGDSGDVPAADMGHRPVRDESAPETTEDVAGRGCARWGPGGVRAPLRAVRSHVPGSFIDRVVPLTINPEPGQVVRVFVGRMEIVTLATAKAVESAVSRNDLAVLNQYGWFLEPILQSSSKGSRGERARDPPGSQRDADATGLRALGLRSKVRLQLSGAKASQKGRSGQPMAARFVSHLLV